MKTTFDQHGINHMTVAISREMTPRSAKPHADADTLFMGGPQPSDHDVNELGLFGQRKNYKVIFPSFGDPANVAEGPTGFHAVVTDGVADTVVLTDGRLWKQDRRSAAVLLFPGIGGVVKLNSKGRLTIREMRGQYHDHGFELAREAVVAGAASKPGKIPVVSMIGGLPTVLDISTMAATFAVA